MASETYEDDDGYPWLSWALTGVLTLAGVLVVGLVISVRNPRSQTAAARDRAAEASKSQVGPSASTGSSPAGPAPTVGASPSVASSLLAVPADPAVAKETPAPAATRSPSENDIPPTISAPRSPLIAPLANEPAPLPSAAATVKPSPEPVAANSTPATPDPVRRAAFVRAVADVRASMAHRNLAASKRGLQAAVANAQSAADQAELERLQALQDHLEQFWNGIRSAVAALQPVDEIVLSESNRVAVIEASRTELAVQREGRPRRYRIEAIPMDVLSAIAKSSFKTTTGSKLIVGSFLAMDALGDRAEAGKLWQEAIRGGENQGTLLLPELSIPRAAGAGRGKP